MSKKDLTEAELAAKKERKAAKKAAKAVVEEKPEKSSEVSDEAAEKAAKKAEKKEKKRKSEAVDGDKAVEEKGSKKSKKVSGASDEESAKFFKDNNMTVSDSSIKPLLKFDDLQVEESLVKPLKNFEKPTPIQSITWPCLLQGKDTIGIAETGSGKTLAFAIPGLSRHVLSDASNKTASILVIAPTRELAVQTYDNIDKLNITQSICLYGGVSKDEQKRTIKKNKPRVIVGTPGRLLDLANDGGVDFSNVKYLVLDEADRMLDQGFEKDITAIISKTLKERQTAMFSATWPQSVRALAATFMKDPVRVTVGSEELTANKRVDQVIETLDNGRMKEQRLNAHLKSIRKDMGNARVLVFALYKKEASRIENTLRRGGHAVGSIHGDLSQQQRMKALADFKDGSVPLLVATDVAARGLDIPNVEVVINVTFPLTIEDYVHRIGRTGRGGAYGKSITFFTDDDKSHAGELMKVLREGGYEIPEGLKKYPAVIKKKEHGAYGAFYKDIGEAPKPKKITFD
ncbi:DEAD-domain-containing protein [Wallemia mellicola]|uniref:RNA helicase n=1 Tax=Wallemia mellicola TaxID=1708541 RepID=A0A4T0PI04_9BASI|nr:DEAD-domain-containing protein [Wallemia mellicola]TIC10431.1 DEAD-domain-containing protein [Wallemia mellicola]TIC29230.1 DEAD-domain-containing protein [Wallemia mellicola]